MLDAATIKFKAQEDVMCSSMFIPNTRKLLNFQDFVAGRDVEVFPRALLNNATLPAINKTRMCKLKES